LFVAWLMLVVIHQQHNLGINSMVRYLVAWFISIGVAIHQQQKYGLNLLVRCFVAWIIYLVLASIHQQYRLGLSF
jgi:hypothetical protein